MKIFSVYDSKAEYYQKPFLSEHIGDVLRTFKDVANDETNPIGKHPEDYVLFLIGEFDQQTGALVPSETKVSLGHALDFKTNEFELKEVKEA